MVVHGNYVYIFGGYNGNYLNKAERMKIGEWRWSNLPNMMRERYNFGVYISETRIYLIGGYNNTSIEYYDITANNFYSLPNIQVPEGGIVCGVINDLIYAVSMYHLRVFNKDFQLIQSTDNINNSSPYCFSDVIVRGSIFIYINSLNSKVYSFDSTSISLREQKTF
jgi:hypothetical protein